MLCGTVPNIGIKIRREESERNGLMIESNKNICSSQHDFLSVGPKIFNKLPIELRTLSVQQRCIHPRVGWKTVIQDPWERLV